MIALRSSSYAAIAPRFGRAMVPVTPRIGSSSVHQARPVFAKAESDSAFEIGEKLSAAVKDVTERVQTTWEETSNAEKPAIVGIILLASILQICIASSMNVIDKTPFFGDLFELIGFIVTANFVFNIVTKPEERTKATDTIDDFIGYMTGSKKLPEATKAAAPAPPKPEAPAPPKAAAPTPIAEPPKPAAPAPEPPKAATPAPEPPKAAAAPTPAPETPKAAAPAAPKAAAPTPAPEPPKAAAPEPPKAAAPAPPKAAAPAPPKAAAPAPPKAAASTPAAEAKPAAAPTPTAAPKPSAASSSALKPKPSATAPVAAAPAIPADAMYSSEAMPSERL